MSQSKCDFVVVVFLSQILMKFPILISLITICIKVFEKFFESFGLEKNFSKNYHHMTGHCGGGCAFGLKILSIAGLCGLGPGSGV